MGQFKKGTHGAQVEQTIGVVRGMIQEIGHIRLDPADRAPMGIELDRAIAALTRVRETLDVRYHLQISLHPEDLN